MRGCTACTRAIRSPSPRTDPSLAASHDRGDAIAPPLGEGERIAPGLRGDRAPAPRARLRRLRRLERRARLPLRGQGAAARPPRPRPSAPAPARRGQAAAVARPPAHRAGLRADRRARTRSWSSRRSTARRWRISPGGGSGGCPSTDLAFLGHAPLLGGPVPAPPRGLHLDLKPSNVISDRGLAKVIDLSIARAPGRGRRGVGTPRYMAPEQVLGGDRGPGRPTSGGSARCCSRRPQERRRSPTAWRRA